MKKELSGNYDESYEFSQLVKRQESTRIEDGIDMVMDAIHKMVECLYDYAETAQEKEIVRKHIDKMKSL